jgi:hypothetical protein
MTSASRCCTKVSRIDLPVVGGVHAARVAGIPGR